jgi:Fic family protein
MQKALQIISDELLEAFIMGLESNLGERFESLKEAEISTDTFSFYTSVASVFSSKIEGEEIDLDSYVKHKKFGVAFQVDYTKKIDDLYLAYEFAKEEELNSSNLKKAHALLTKHFLSENEQGTFRNHNMYVTAASGRIEYVAALPNLVEGEMSKLFADIELLLDASLTIEEVFFYASFIHLVFVKIHPFGDRNGRTARLLEKWFLAKKLGAKAWFVESEKYYYEHHGLYYHNIRLLGLEYPELDYMQPLSFVKMLAGSVG